jgi:hypothetical protein
MQLRRLVLATFVALVASLAAAAGSAAAPSFPPAGSADVRPGSMTETDGAQCTGNFVFFDSANDLYIGQAAHCSGTGGSTATNGCESGSLPNGTKVEIEGASQPGTMVYNSWITMQQKNETNANACDYNDFALVKIDPADHDEVNPTIPFWGGPNGITGTTTSGESVYGYGNSSLRGGADELKPKQGRSLGQSGGGWNHQVYTFTPGIPGDSGSAFINLTGKAFGVLATVQIAPLAASNGVGDLSRELTYMRNNDPAFSDVTLAQGTEPFTGGMTAALGLR